METKAFEELSLQKTFYAGWRNYKKHPVLLTGSIAFFAVFMFLSIVIFDSIIPVPKSMAWMALSQIFFFLLSSFFQIGLFKIALKLSIGKEATFKDLFKHGSLLPVYAIAYFLFSVMIGFGILLLVVPGLIWATQFCFYPFFVVDKGLDPIEALKASSNMTKGHRWTIAGFLLLMALINVIGAALLYVGLFVTGPVTLMAFTYIYRKLS